MAEQFSGDSGSKIREADEVRDRKWTDGDGNGYGSRSPAEQEAAPDIENLTRLSMQGFRSIREKQISTETQIIDLGNRLKFDDDKRANAHHGELSQEMQSWRDDIVNAVERAKPQPHQFADIWKQDLSKVNEQMVTIFSALNLLRAEVMKETHKGQPVQQQQQQQQQQGGGSDKYLFKMNELAKENFVLRVEREYEKLGIKDNRVDSAWNDRWNSLKLEANSFVQTSNSDVTGVFDRTCKDLFADLKNLSPAKGFFSSQKPADLMLAINWTEYMSRFASSNKSESVPPRKENRVADPSDSYPNTSPSTSSSAASSLTSSSLTSSSLTSSVRPPTNAYGYPVPTNAAYGLALAPQMYKAAPPQFCIYYDLDEKEVIGLAEFIGKNLQGPLKKIYDGTVIEKPCAVITFIVLHDRIDVAKWKPLWAERQQRSDNRHVLVIVYSDVNPAPSSSQYAGWIPEFANIVTVTPFTVLFDSSGTGKLPKQLFLPKESSPCFSAIDSFVRPFRTQSQR